MNSEDFWTFPKIPELNLKLQNPRDSPYRWVNFISSCTGYRSTRVYQVYFDDTCWISHQLENSFFRIENFSVGIFKINLFVAVTSAANIWNFLFLMWQKCHQFVTQIWLCHPNLTLSPKLWRFVTKGSLGRLICWLFWYEIDDSDITWLLTCHVISFS